jgi:glutamate-1-semialdehyde 2,1-aminomutase
MVSHARAHMPNGTPMAWMASEYDQPVYVSHGQGAAFTDVDGFTYLDFNASDMSMFCGHANPAIVAAVQAQVARSTQFLLPTEASVEVAEELSRRYQLLQWQFTLSATQANTEAIRLARAVTGREVVVLFEGTTTAISRRAWWTWQTARPGRCSAACPGGLPAGCG